MCHIVLLSWLTVLAFLLVVGQANGKKVQQEFRPNKDRAVHLALFRRPSRFSRHSLFNVSSTEEALSRTERRYLQTSTEAHDNRIVRQWCNGPNGVDDYMFSVAGQKDSWYTIMRVGDPPQAIEVDIDMLSPDFHFITTSSSEGAKYDVFRSTSRKSSDEHAHPLCPISNEVLSLNSLDTVVQVNIPLCQPGRYSLQTLANSGAVLGLSPLGQSSTLSRLSSPNLLSQLKAQGLIEHNIVSLTLLDSKSGVLSLGGSIAPEIEETKIRAEKALAYMRSPDREKMEDEIRGAMAFAIPAGSTHEQHFKWTDVGSGAVAGWHMTLVAGVWVNGIKVLKNQAVLFDVNCPFILAPPGAADAVYEVVPGGRALSSLLDLEGASEIDKFYAFPCLSEIDIAFEIADRKFPLGKSELREDALHGPSGGLFSLGQVDVGGNDNNPDQRMRTGYCAGIIVSSTVGIRKEASRSAMRDVWVLGEPFFRGLGVAFDMGARKAKTRVGVRVY